MKYTDPTEAQARRRTSAVESHLSPRREIYIKDVCRYRQGCFSSRRRQKLQPWSVPGLLK